MTDNEVEKLKEIIVLTAAYYNHTVLDPVLLMYIKDLSDLPITHVMAAYEDYRRNPKNRIFPLPAQIRAILEPKVNPDAHGREVAARIREAVSRFGWSSPIEAHQFIGEIGWKVVQSWGGWNYICENLGRTIDMSSFYAQCRDRARDLAEFGVQLDSFDRPQLENKSTNQLQSFNEILKKLGAPNPEPN